VLIAPPDLQAEGEHALAALGASRLIRDGSFTLPGLADQLLGLLRLYCK
jgi:hypothetical protein